MSKEYLIIALMIFLVIFGAIANVMKHFKDLITKKILYGWKDMTVDFILSLFAGLVFAFLARLYTENILWTGFVGMGGAFMGIGGAEKLFNVGMDIVLNLIKSKNGDNIS